MAGGAVPGVSGGHARVAAEKIDPGMPGPDSSEVAQQRKKDMEKPVKVSYSTITYPDGKRKVVEERLCKDGSRKFRQALLWKNGKVLSGRIPEGWKP